MDERHYLTIPEMPFVARDGRRHGWLDVQTHIQRILRAKFPRVEREIRADASQEALLDLMGYWQFLPSSHKETGLDFHYALLRGSHFAATKVFAMVGQRRMEVPMAFDGHDAYHEEDDVIEMDVAHRRVDDDPTADEVIEEIDLTERARRMLAEMSPTELEDAFNNLLSGETEREQAEREGVNRNAIHERRGVRRRRIREGARKYGLVF